MICDRLQITYKELHEQPEWWVDNMIILQDQKNKLEELEMKKQQSKTKKK